MKIVLVAGSLIACNPLLAEECCFDSCRCEEGPQSARFTLRSRQPGGIGYPTGYTSLDYFYSPSISANYRPFFDLSAHIFNNGKPAFNAGLGLRYLSDCSDVVYGGNIYWDYRDAKHTSFQQFGLGLETLWTRWDLHLNVYAPFNRHKKSYRTGFQQFQGNFAYFYKKYELALWGTDLDLGYIFYDCGWISLRGTLGGYYFHGDYGKQAAGALLRSTIRATDYFSLEGQVSYDSLYKWNGQGEISLHLPLGKTVKRYPRKTSCCADIIAIEKRLVEKPTRFEIIPTISHKKIRRAIDPVTGQPLFFIFVDNTSSSRGTFEDPFHSLAQAVAASRVGDVIYVFPGDGTSNGLSTNSVLKERQSLAGSAAPIEFTTPFGTIEIPKQSDAIPRLAGSGTMVTLANSSRVSGLTITSTNDVAIRGTNVTDISIANTSAMGPSGAVVMSGSGGSIEMKRNTLQASATWAVQLGLNRRFNAEIGDNLTPVSTSDGWRFDIANSEPSAITFSRNSVNAVDRALEYASTAALQAGLASSRVEGTIKGNIFKGSGAATNPTVSIVSEGSSNLDLLFITNTVQADAAVVATNFNASDTSTMNLRATTNSFRVPEGQLAVQISSAASAELRVFSLSEGAGGFAAINTPPGGGSPPPETSEES